MTSPLQEALRGRPPNERVSCWQTYPPEEERAMAIEILEIHHTGVRIDTGAQKLAATETFYKDVLGLERDTQRPTIPGIPGAWINVGEVGQIHLLGGEQPSPVANGPGEDPTRPHIAFAVKDIVATRQALERMGAKYWVIERLT